jgi:hypothetical protein
MGRSRIHERTISLRFLGIIWRVLSIHCSHYNQFRTTFALSFSIEVAVNSMRKTLKTFVPITSKNSASRKVFCRIAQDCTCSLISLHIQLVLRESHPVETESVNSICNSCKQSNIPSTAIIARRILYILIYQCLTRKRCLSA